MDIVLAINPLALQAIEDQGLSTNCSPHPFVRREVNDHPASLETACGQHVDSLSLCWLSRPGYTHYYYEIMDYKTTILQSVEIKQFQLFEHLIIVNENGIRKHRWDANSKD